jgi:hypothetical protein
MNRHTLEILYTKEVKDLVMDLLWGEDRLDTKDIALHCIDMLDT